MQQKKNSAQGFTLIELLIVIAIIGLLATLAIVSLTGAQSKARDTKRIADAKQYQGALELYYNKYNVYPAPATWAAFVADETGKATSTPTSGGIGEFITQAPSAPYNTDTDWYAYSRSTNKIEYVFVVRGLEADNAALDGDDDGVYLATASGDWAAGDFAANDIYSIGAIPTTAFATCADGASQPFMYCVSE